MSTATKSTSAKTSTKASTNGKAAPATERAPRARKEGLRLPQIRVLHVLSKAKGPLTRHKISDACGNKTVVVVGRAVGYSDPAKRAAFEQTKDGGFTKSLLSLGYVKERDLKSEADGINETVIELTAAGKKAYAKLGKVQLPALRD